MNKTMHEGTCQECGQECEYIIEGEIEVCCQCLYPHNKIQWCSICKKREFGKEYKMKYIS